MPLTLDPMNSIGAVARRRLLGEPDPPYSGDTANQVPGLDNMRPPPQVEGGPSQGLDSTAPVTLGGAGGGYGNDPVGVGTAPLGAGVPRWQTWAEANPEAPIADTVAAAHIKALTANPQLPAAPLGQFTDSTFEASNAVLQQQINAAYQDILQQTGYDVGGKHIPGAVEQQAARVERDQLTGMNNAVNDVTGRMQQAGTVFSGYHALERGAASQPFVTALGDLAIDTPKTLAGYVEKASDLQREYVVQRNLLLQQAADREAARLAALKPDAPPAPPPEPAPVDYTAGIPGEAYGGDFQHANQHPIPTPPPAYATPVHVRPKKPQPQYTWSPSGKY